MQLAVGGETSANLQLVDHAGEAASDLGAGKGESRVERTPQPHLPHGLRSGSARCHVEMVEHIIHAPGVLIERCLSMLYFCITFCTQPLM